MNRLGIDPDKYKYFEEESDEKFSFVLINPPNDFFLKPGDIIYLLKPGSFNSNANMTEISDNFNTKNNSDVYQTPHDLYYIDDDVHGPGNSTNNMKSENTLPTTFHSIDETFKEFQLDDSFGFKPSKFGVDNLKQTLFHNSSSLKSFKKDEQLLNNSRNKDYLVSSPTSDKSLAFFDTTAQLGDFESIKTVLTPSKAENGLYTTAFWLD